MGCCEGSPKREVYSDKHLKQSCFTSQGTRKKKKLSPNLAERRE